MKNIRYLIAFVIAAVLCTAAFAQEAATAAAPAALDLTPSGLVQWLTPIITPVVLLGVKKFLPKLPSGLIPLLAPIVGVALELANSLATSHQSNFLLAAALGLLGVGLREVKEAVKPSENGGWPAANG